ncbi:hypothetical protein R1sor_023005 [Riccia sorocarpa]|uniref:Ubiquitin carboxyl-terminal hydrolase n=1 Tax=Riccia sorocarpa TaxID=122646 RepID=A0ABD3GQM5_9MARC
MQSKKKKKEDLLPREIKPDNKWFAYYREKFGSSTSDKPPRASQGESTSSATSRGKEKEKAVARTSGSQGQERVCSMKGSDSIVLPLAYKRIPYEEEQSKNSSVRILGGGLAGNRERRPDVQRSGSSRNIEREESRRRSSVSKEIDSLLALPRVFRDGGKEQTGVPAFRSSSVITSGAHLSTSSRRRSDSNVFLPERSKGANDKFSRSRRRSAAPETQAPSSSPVNSTFSKRSHRSERLYEPAVSSNQTRKPSLKKPGVPNEVSLSDSSSSESDFGGQISNDRPDVHRRAGETINDASSCSSSGSVSSVSLNSRLTEMNLQSDQARRPSASDDKLAVNFERRTSQSTNYERVSLMSSSSGDSRAPRDSAASRSRMGMGIGGLVGLMNEGNTCYLNSCLQCLAHLLPLASSVQGSLPDVGQRRGSGRAGSSERDFSSLTELLAYSFRQLVRDLWQRPAFSATSARTFLQCVQAWAPQFSGHSQHDAQEVLRAILDGLHEALNKVTTTPPYRDLYVDPKPEEELAKLTWRYHKQCQDSIIQDIFCGQLQSTIECCTCRRKSHCFDPFLDLSLPFPKNAGESSMRDQFRGGHSKARVTLQDCVSAFVAPEQLEGSNKYYCPSCKRFFKSDRYSYQKDDTPVYYPLRGLDLTDFLPPRRGGREAVIYDLYGVCCHMGSLSGGHYTALCKNWENDMWYCFNDSSVSPTQESSVITSSAYILFYQQRT